MKVLIIDDEPIRAHPVMNAGHDVRIAHGHEQIKFWLQNKHWTPDIICLDNDMPLMSGKDVAYHFGDELFYRRVRVWSRNNIAAPEIKRILLDKALEYCIDEEETDIEVLAFDSDIESDYWSEILNEKGKVK